ncbi:MAG TPA: hypothetical protein VLA14_06655 [Polyangia bacterium]|jgi:hypothetical protein|nr:hypothetical protein [Polyangia bacterium]
MLRRWSLGVALSVAVHVAALVGVVAWSWFRGVGPSAIDIDVTGMHMQELEDLPLGAPPTGAQPTRARPRAHASPAQADKGGTLATRAEPTPPRAGADDAADDEASGPGPTDLRQLGPEGSRFTMLLRVDRLKNTPFAEPVDALLMRMPDRRDLLEGTGLSFYDDFEALLIATPNPLDYTATFLAARHHLGDVAMRSAIDRGARATNRVVAWRAQDGRPWGERHARGPASALPGARDERIIVLPAPGLVVVTPPAYRALLRAPARAAAADGGLDAGDVDGGAPAPSWAALLRRIDDETGLLPADAVAMASAVDLFKRAPGAPPPALLGVELEVPRALTVVMGVAPEPYFEITAAFADEAAARRCEESWPTLQRRLRTNPYLVLGGLSSLAARITATREGGTVRLRLTSSTDEAVRVLLIAARAFGG